MNSRIRKITEDYLDGKLDRRKFFWRMSAALGSYTLVHHYLETSGLAAGAITTLESSQRNVASSEIQYPSGDHQVIASLNIPSGEGPFPAIIVIHENRGLNDHTRDLARRFAAEGYVALAPDLLSRKGGTAAATSPDHARELIGEISWDDAIEDLLAAHRYLEQLPESRGQKVGSIGFCWGGARSFLLATADSDLAACVVFYGTPPAAEQLDKIQCPVMGVYGELDQRVTSTVESTARALKEKGKSFEYTIYPGAQHAFFNDTRQERYHEESALDAWQRTLTFFDKHLQGS